MLHEQVGHLAQRLHAALPLAVVVLARAPHRGGDGQDVARPHRRRERHLALQVVDGRLALVGPVRGQVVVGGEHAADAAHLDIVRLEDTAGLVRLVAEVVAVVVAVQLDVADPGLGQPLARALQGLDAESPVAPREVEAPGDGLLLLELLEGAADLLVLDLEVLWLHDLSSLSCQGDLSSPPLRVGGFGSPGPCSLRRGTFLIATPARRPGPSRHPASPARLPARCTLRSPGPRRERRARGGKEIAPGCGTHPEKGTAPARSSGPAPGRA